VIYGRGGDVPVGRAAGRYQCDLFQESLDTGTQVDCCVSEREDVSIIIAASTVLAHNQLFQLNLCKVWQRIFGNGLKLEH
jgi:hypothetical protein